MAKTPSNDGPGHQPNQSPSLGGSATGHRADVVLTGSARIYAGKFGLERALGTMKLGAECLTGDIVSISSGSDTHDFAVLRRRWLVDGDTGKLEITLDHPVRGR